MASLLSILLILMFSSTFLCSSSQISRKELRDDEFKQEMVIQFRSSVHSNRIDPSRVVQLSWRPRVFLYEGFLSDEECDHLIFLAHKTKETSSRQDDSSVDTIKKTLLKSSETPQLIKDDVVSRIEERISAWTFLPKENGKALQILRYENEDSEKKLDYFGNSSLLDQSKPLIATVVLYLSNVNNGGEIIFPKSEVKGNIWSDCTKSSSNSSSDIPKPIKGNAVLFFNIFPNSTTDSTSSHARCPVLEGEMWYAIKFFQAKFIAEEKPLSGSGDEDCTDEDDNCPMWAAMGECKKNAIFMVGSLDYYGTCRKSCNAC